jgi:TrmH family RNA methyltransferase
LVGPQPLIRSRSNARIQRALAVFAGKDRSLVALEGERLVLDAVRAGVVIESVFVVPGKEALVARIAQPASQVHWVEPDLMQRVSSLEQSPGVLALAVPPESKRLRDLPVGPRMLLLVVCGVADPGNLGALARSAEALGAAGILPLDGASPWLPKTLRGSMGSLFRLPLYRASSTEEAALELERLGCRQVAAATRSGRDVARFDWSGPIALWISGETAAAPACFERFERVTIPMAGASESLNVTVAASLLMEAVRRSREGAR